GLADPEFLQAGRGLVEQSRKKFKEAPGPQSAWDLARNCQNLAGLLRMGDHGPYLVEARALLAEGRDALKKLRPPAGPGQREADLLKEIEGQLKELDARKGRAP